MSTVLIVEDDLAIADLLQEALEASGFTVTEIARTVAEAVAAAAHHHTDFAVIDVHLANGDRGTDVAAHLRRIGGIGVILSTGYDIDGLDVAHADAIMVKPYRMSDVARGLAIIGEIAATGTSALPFPHKFKLTGQAAVQHQVSAPAA
jgi:CheY-like chemotaxis protein